MTRHDRHAVARDVFHEPVELPCGVLAVRKALVEDEDVDLRPWREGLGVGRVELGVRQVPALWSACAATSEMSTPV